MTNRLLKLLVLMTLIAIAAVLLVTAAMADDDGTAQAPEQHSLVEWDGTTLNVRSVPVSSAVEREFLDEYNRKNQVLADRWRQHQSGELPERDVIETEYGTVRVEKTALERNESAAVSPAISVEVEHVETPYGLITIEKHSSQEPLDEVGKRD